MKQPERARGVHHLAIGVRDLPAVEAFYTQVLRLPVQRRWPRPDGAPGDRSVWLDLGGGAFLALERADQPSAGAGRPAPEGYLMAALAISRDERASWEAWLAAAGVAVVRRTPYTLYVEDPEGNRVGLSHWPDAAGDPPTS
jgi:catechol 2,3-dioxygenase-like lactoylglutathione lyase family enzyme